MSLKLMSAQEISKHIAKKAQEKRLSLNLSQETLGELSGVSLSVLKKFEQTGKISLESLLKIALPLNSIEDFDHLFKPSALTPLRSLDDLFKDQSRKRGRK